MSEYSRDGRCQVDYFILNLRDKTTGQMYDEPIGVMPDQYVNDVVSYTIRGRNADLVSIMYPDRSYFEKPAPTQEEWEAANVRIVVNLRSRSDARLTRIDHAVARGQSADPQAQLLALMHEAEVVSITLPDGTPYVVDTGKPADEA